MATATKPDRYTRQLREASRHLARDVNQGAAGAQRAAAAAGDWQVLSEINRRLRAALDQLAEIDRLYGGAGT